MTTRTEVVGRDGVSRIVDINGLVIGWVEDIKPSGCAVLHTEGQSFVYINHASAVKAGIAHKSKRSGYYEST